METATDAKTVGAPSAQSTRPFEFALVGGELDMFALHNSLAKTLSSRVDNTDCTWISETAAAVTTDMARTAQTVPAPAGARCLSSAVTRALLCVLLLCLLHVPAPALGGAVYHLQADTDADLLGDYAVQPLGACTPAADNDLAGKFFQV